MPKDARRIREAAGLVSNGWLHEKNMCPSNDDEHATVKKMTVSVFMSMSLRADHTPVTEPAWLSRVVNLLSSEGNNYLDSLNIDLRNQFEERYRFLTGKTIELSSRLSSDLEAQLPMPKGMLPRARYALLIDSTFLKIMPIDNVLSDVMVMKLLLSRITKMAEILAAMFDPEMTVTYGEPPPKIFVISNVLDHLACE